MKVVLGSGSPRRRELLTGLGLAFDVRVADIDESVRPDEAAIPYVERLALDKARAVTSKLESSALVIAADTIVELDGALLGKPSDSAEAKQMLRRLSGATHSVHTGVAVSWNGIEQVDVASTGVRFHAMTDAEIDWYVATGEPMDKAGAYGIQAYGALFVAGLDGGYFNVVGLPVDLLYRLVESLGIRWQTLPEA